MVITSLCVLVRVVLVLTLSGSLQEPIQDRLLVMALGMAPTTFNIPDYRGEFLRGYDFSRGVDTNRYIGSFKIISYKTINITQVMFGVYAAGVGGFAGGTLNFC